MVSGLLLVCYHVVYFDFDVVFGFAFPYVGLCVFLTVVLGLGRWF